LEFVPSPSGSTANFTPIHGQRYATQSSRAGISNYSIFHMREMNLLFSYYEYRGQDRAADARRMALNPAMQEWWKLCRPCQVPLAPTNGERRWIDVEPIFFQE
jgi:L-rhamnose mutarotase